MERRFDPQVEPLLSTKVRGHLLFLVREAVSNIVLHADAGHVEIDVSRSAESVTLRVTNDGRGFDQAGPASTAGGIAGSAIWPNARA